MTQEHVPRVISLAITCTDKGQHEWRALGDLGIIDGLLRANRTQVYGAVADRRKHECVWIDEFGRAQMRCPNCGRNPQWPPAKAMNALTTLHAAGITMVDLSHLPKHLS